MELRGHTSQIYELAFSSKEPLLVSSDYRGSVRLWNPETGQALGVLIPERDVQCYMAPLLNFSPDGNYLVTGSACEGDSIRIWDISSRKELMGWKGTEISSLAWSNDGKLLALGSDRVMLHDSTTGQVFRRLQDALPDWAMSLAWGPDGRYLAGGSTLYDPAVLIWDVKTDVLQARTPPEFSTGGGNIEQLLFIDNTTLLYALGYGTAYSWNSETGKTEVIFDADSDRSGGVDFHDAISVDGRLIAFAKQEGYQKQSVHQREDGSYWTYFQPFDDSGHDVFVVDLATKVNLHTFKAHEEELGYVAFSPDARFLATGDLDGHLYVWNLF